MRLIDADALTERMYHDAFETDTDMQKWDSGCWIRYKMFENAVDSAPTIDAVADRPQGWIPVSERLPKTGVANMCLVTVEFPRAHSRGVYFGSRIVDNEWEYLTIEGTWQTLPGISKVLAWMPIEPWKGAGDE